MKKENSIIIGSGVIGCYLAKFLLSKSKYKEKYLIGTGLNSLNETINLMKVLTL